MCALGELVFHPLPYLYFASRLPPSRLTRRGRPYNPRQLHVYRPSDRSPATSRRVVPDRFSRRSCPGIFLGTFSNVFRGWRTGHALEKKKPFRVRRGTIWRAYWFRSRPGPRLARNRTYVTEKLNVSGSSCNLLESRTAFKLAFIQIEWCRCSFSGGGGRGGRRELRVNDSLCGKP